MSIIEVTPDRGETGDAITIQGTAFGADPGSNKVTIGGVPATIDSASATTIVARIPDGATDGPVVVTTPTGTATADETLSIGSLAPVIDSVSPLLIKAGDHITLTGNGFGPGSHDADVVVGGTHARVDLATDAILSAYLPREAGSGAVSVSTEWGEVAGPDVFILPDPYTPYQVGTTARVEIAVATPMVVPVGKIGLLLVDAQVGERLRVTSPGVAVPVSLFDPRNHPLPMPTVGADASQSERLAQSGTYLIVVDATFTTPEVLASGLTVTVVKDVETAAIADGEPVTMRLTEPGQHGRVQFAAVAGDTVIAVGGAANIYAGSTLLDPFGIRVAFGTSTGIVVPVTKLDATGVYTLDLDAQEGVGEITVQVLTALPATTASILPDGNPVTLTVAQAGQEAHATFEGIAGARVSLVAETRGGCFTINLHGPDGLGTGASLYGCDGSDAFLEPFALPSTGTFDITMSDPGTATGDVTIRLYEVPGDLQGVLTPGGAGQTLAIEAPGQNASLTFDGEARVAHRLSLTDVTVSDTRVQVLAPDGSYPAGVSLDPAGAVLDLPPSEVAGSYVVTFDPHMAATGTISVAVAPVPEGARIGTRASALLGANVMVADEKTRSDGCAPAAASAGGVADLPTDWRPPDAERWTPGPTTVYGDWTTGRAPSPWEQVPSLDADVGITALSGRVLRLDGLPLAGVMLSVGSHSTCTDASGRILADGAAGRPPDTRDRRPPRQHGHPSVRYVRGGGGCAHRAHDPTALHRLDATAGCRQSNRGPSRDTWLHARITSDSWAEHPDPGRCPPGDRVRAARDRGHVDPGCHRPCSVPDSHDRRDLPDVLHDPARGSRGRGWPCGDHLSKRGRLDAREPRPVLVV